MNNKQYQSFRLGHNLADVSKTSHKYLNITSLVATNYFNLLF